jgi:hypothetical protein
METVLIEDVTIYQDFSMKKPFNTFLGNYDVEIVGEKARVIQNSVFSSQRQKSRLAKLHKSGQAGGEHHYELTVNGKKVYFRVEHNIYNQ